ncbi:DUF4193 domain-containing protein [Glutamicibacter sp. MNS18]|uniref:DUF4193 domain-containing protein n=1 Tax=Glutamicibacter sp. MNS18 TaxID=2989817 RepID=UPI0022357EFD|nr:DUF4193 domain-containing protein [Glutamicibacter sp. MNS18]MCW4464466.1 DUF4193 domain-containing protein [Glutamicibacter sp. MNS18]
MATDYDAPRDTSRDEEAAKQLAGLNAGKTATQASLVDEDEAELAESFLLPGAEVNQDEVSVEIMPEQADEFTCASCFMVRHRSLLARQDGAQFFCAECED